MRIGSLACVFALLGCSSGDFQVSNAGGDSAVEETGATSDSGATGDTGSATDGVASDAVAEGGAPCTPLAPKPSDLYVDMGSTRPAVGTEDCPLRTIHDALALNGTLPSGARTIHVVGGSTDKPNVYNEPAGVIVKASVTLKGDGPKRTEITGGPAECLDVGQCTVMVEGAAALEGFTVHGGSARHAIVLGPPLIIGAAIRNVIARDAAGANYHGVVAKDGGAIGPDVFATKNNGNGLTVLGGRAHVYVFGGTGTNGFDANDGWGVAVETGGALDFDGGTAQNNQGGVKLLGVPAFAHTITNLVAKGNTGPGLAIMKDVKAKVRGSTFQKNGYGVLSAWSGIDLGTDSDNGHNVFGDGTFMALNKYAGICFANATDTVPAVGDKWTTCPPTFVTGGCDGSGTYQDVIGPVGPTGAKLWVNAAMCSVGP